MILLIIYNGINILKICQELFTPGDETIIKARYLEFKDIVPQWFEKLDKLLHENDSEIVNDILWKLYPEINSYDKCVLGEAYGYESSYIP